MKFAQLKAGFRFGKACGRKKSSVLRVMGQLDRHIKNDGGFLEVTSDVYLNEAPEKGYQPQYEMKRYATNVINYASWPTFRTDRTFYFKSRGGKVYGHFQIKELEPDYRGMAAIRIESYVNPAGSRNLEFEASKQIR